LRSPAPAIVNAGVPVAVNTVLLPFSIKLTLFAFGSVPLFLYVLNWTTTLGVIPPYPICKAPVPIAAAPAALFCSTKAMPSPPAALGPIWKMKWA
jgi:hypothetical protein